MRSSLVFLSFTALTSTACGLDLNLDDLLGTKAKTTGCVHSSECADDELCDSGRCRKIGGEGEGEGQPGEGEGEGEGDTPPDPQGPQFLQFSTNITTMGPNDTAIFTVVVTDPDGIDDVIGGSLVDPASGGTYGAFETSAAEGSYELSLGWFSLNTVNAIDFASSAPRSFRARFFDQAGHVSEKTVSLTLSCGGTPACGGSCGLARCGDGQCTSASDFPDENGNGICGNTCASLTTNQHCGSCETSCSTSCGSFNGEGLGCTCTHGSQCGSGDACVDSACVSGGSISFSGSSGTPAIPTVSLQGSTFNMCAMSTTAVQMYCQAAGFSSGAIAFTEFDDFGVQANCDSASTFSDCAFNEQSSCSISAITCGSTGGGGSLTCAADGNIPDTAVDGAFLETDVSGRSSQREATCGGAGPEAGYTFTATSAGTFRFIAYGEADNAVLAVFDGDCDGTQLACASDSTGVGNAEADLFLNAGQRVVLVADTAFAPSSGDVFGQVIPE